MNTRAAVTSLCALIFFGIINVRIADAAPSAPTPLAPADGAGVTEPFTISWSAVNDPSGIVAYNWQVSPSSAFTPVILQDSTSGATEDVVSGLANGTYFWRVQAVNGAFEQGAWSQARSFTVNGTSAAAPATPTLGPTKGYSTFHPMEYITFNWSAAAGASTYVLQFSKDSSFPVGTRGQFDNIPDTTFTFAFGDGESGNYVARVFAVSADGIFSAPSNLISFSVSFNNPLPPPPSPLAPANGATLTLPVTFTWTDVPNPQPSGYELQVATDSGFKNLEFFYNQITPPTETVTSLTAGTKFWRVRSAQGDSSPTTAAVTDWSATRSFTISSAPPTPVSVSVTNNPLFSGDTTWVQVQLSAAAPPTGASIAMSSSNSTAAPVPASVVMQGNIAWMQFMITAGQVASATPVTITATLNGKSASVAFDVMPPSLRSLSISPSTISGGGQPGGIVMLNGTAPPGGALVSLSSSSPAVSPPATVTVNAGLHSVSFPISTSEVTANTTATVTATWKGASVQANVTLTAQQPPATITLNPTSTVGAGGSSFATVTVASPNSADEILQVSSSSPAVASVPNGVMIPAGSTTGGFNVFTSSVSAQTFVTISVSGGGVTRSATLRVDPESAPAPSTSTGSATLTVTASGRSGERVTSTPAGISVPVGSTGSASFTTGTSITLSVSNGRDAIWSGACSSGGNKAKSCTLKLSANASVTANVQ